MRAEAEPWRRQAQADLRSAEILQEAAQHYAVSWFAQQAAEKALKAVLVEGGQDIPPRSHDLKFLAEETNAPSSIQTDGDMLNPVFALARYPDVTSMAPVDAITEADAQQYLAYAQRIVQWVDTQL